MVYCSLQEEEFGRGGGRRQGQDRAGHLVKHLVGLGLLDEEPTSDQDRRWFRWKSRLGRGDAEKVATIA